MEYYLTNHIYALIGFLSYSLLLIWQFKNARDAGKYKGYTWKKYFGKTWDDYTVMLIVGQLLTTIQETFVTFYTSWFVDDIDKSFAIWAKWIDSMEFISFIIGALGVFILSKFFRFTKSQIDNYG